MGEIQLSVQELFVMPENSYQLVDIRDERARSYGVIPGSVALSAEELPESQEIDKNKTVVIYCQKGEMSVPAAEALQEAGVDAKSLNGGYLAWLMEAMKQRLRSMWKSSRVSAKSSGKPSGVVLPVQYVSTSW